MENPSINTTESSRSRDTVEAFNHVEASERETSDELRKNNNRVKKPKRKTSLISHSGDSTNTSCQLQKTEWGQSVRLAMESLDSDQYEKFANKVAKLRSVKRGYKLSIQNRNRHSASFSKPTYPACTDSASAGSTFKLSKASETGAVHTVRDIAACLYQLSSSESSNLCQQLELLVKFDELEGWRESGAKNCASWANSALQLDIRTAWERLRVGRCLRELPVIQRLFSQGKLSYSKVRLLTRVASGKNEQLLAHASIDSSVADVQRLCEEYRWQEDDEASDERKATQQWERRRLNWQSMPDGSIQIRIVLPPEHAQNFLHAIEQSEELLYFDDESDEPGCNHTENEVNELTPAQRRADAAVLLAERSLAHDGPGIAAADRYQVVLNLDSSLPSSTTTANNEIPTKKPWIEGIGALPVASAKYLTCDCTVMNILSDKGEPLSIGRKSRLWPAPMRRAILTRDRHCQFPGCTSHRFLHIHHLKHWIDGGETSVENGVCLCQFHHRLIHTGKYSIERAFVSKGGTENGELHSENVLSTGFFSQAKKKLLPTRCRFRVIKTKNTVHVDSEFSSTSSAVELVKTTRQTTEPIL